VIYSTEIYILLKLIEVKEGDKNVQAIQILEEQPDVVRNIESLTVTYGENLASQVSRVYRQKIRADRAIQIMETGVGPDSVSGITVTINEPSLPPLGYDYELAKLLLRLDQETWAYTALEGALLIGCYRDYMKPVGHESLKAVADQFIQAQFLYNRLWPRSSNRFDGADICKAISRKRRNGYCLRAD